MKFHFYSLTNLIAIFFFIMVSTACKKKEMPAPNPCTNPPCNTTPTDSFMVWQIPMTPDYKYGFSMDPVLDGNYLYFSNLFTAPGAPIHKVNKLTGEHIWTTNSDCKYEHESRNFFYQTESKIVLKQYYCLNFRNKSDGAILNEINFKDFDNGACYPRLSGFGNWVFVVTTQYNKNPLTARNNLVRCNIDTYKMDTLFSLPYLNGYEQAIEPPAAYVATGGDTMLLFQSRNYNFKIADGRIDFFCYNMTQRKLVWRLEDIEDNGTGSINTPQIVGDRVYYQGSNELFMFDIATGNKIWSRRFPGESYFYTQNLIVGNTIFVKDDGDRFKALDLNTGNTLWEAYGEYGGGLGPAYANGIVFIMGTDEGYAAIYGLRADTGKQFWKYRTPNYKKFSDSTFGYINMISDPETGYLYTGDGVFMMCLKPPK